MFMNNHDRKKIEEIYSCYKRDLFITAYSILKDYTEAEDVVQNAILKISKNLEKIQDVKCKKTRSYMVIIVRNLCYDIYNKKKHTQFIPFDEMQEIASEDQTDMDDYIVNIEKSNEIAKQLEKLHPSYADILTLRYYH